MTKTTNVDETTLQLMLDSLNLSISRIKVAIDKAAGREIEGIKAIDQTKRAVRAINAGSEHILEAANALSKPRGTKKSAKKTKGSR